MRDRYATMEDFKHLPLPQLEKTIEAYIEIGENCDWDITPQFESELRYLTMLAKMKGSVKQF